MILYMTITLLCIITACWLPRKSCIFVNSDVLGIIYSIRIIITRSSWAQHGGAASLRGGRQVPQSGCGWSRTAFPSFHPNSYSARKIACVRSFITRSDPCGGRARTKRGARWLKPSYVMRPCDFQKVSMLQRFPFLALITIRVIVSIYLDMVFWLPRYRPTLGCKCACSAITSYTNHKKTKHDIISRWEQSLRSY